MGTALLRCLGHGLDLLLNQLLIQVFELVQWTVDAFDEPQHMP